MYTDVSEEPGVEESMTETAEFSESGAFLLELDSSSYKALQPV